MALIDEEYVRISLRSEEFRINFEEPFRAVFALALIGTIGWFVWQDLTSFVLLGLVIPLVTGALAVVGIEILRRRYTFQISPQGLSCYDFWGWKRTIPWSEMRAARTFKFAGLDYVRIRADKLRSEIWLPLFVEKYQLMCDLVSAHVDTGHPLYARLLEMKPDGGASRTTSYG